ncbi:MAG: carboxypeptidase M32 [Anaerolineae bacterium]
MENLNALKTRLNEVHYLQMVLALLEWDQQVMMPPGGDEHRAAQIATVSRLHHELFTAEETGRLLEAAEQEAADLPYDSDDASLLRVARHDYDLATRVPASLVAEIARVTALAHNEWARARANNDFAAFKPRLKQIFDLKRQEAEALGYTDHIYDALLDQFEPGMKTAEITRLFEELKAAQIPMIRAIAAQQDRVDNAVLRREYDEARQEQLSREVAAQLGYNFTNGRLDRAVHPFSTSFGSRDVRITTRYERTWLPAALFGTIHEAGHAMYEQGSAESISGTMLEGGTSLGVHESQSRLWENLVGRSREFWTHYFPRLKALFPETLADTDLETFYRAVNRVAPSLIRVEADEVTYNMHVIIRFELEKALLEGSLSIDDAPEAWNARYEEYLGVRPPNDTLGILQDVHWSSGLIGYFPTYTLGNLMSVPFFNCALKDHPDIPAQIARGEFGTLLGWLQEHIYAHGRKYMPGELFQRVTGETMTAAPYLDYLRTKYGELYDL